MRLNTSLKNTIFVWITNFILNFQEKEGLVFSGIRNRASVYFKSYIRNSFRSYDLIPYIMLDNYSLN